MSLLRVDRVALRGAAGLSLVAGLLTGAAGLAQTAAEPVVYYDATPLLKLDLADPAVRRRFWDECHLLFALQGLANRESPRLFVRFLAEPDDFWWGEMTRSGGWLAGRAVERLDSLEALLPRFAGVHRGAVVWDERVPATSNLASTIAGCDDLLPLRYAPEAGSLYTRLTGSPTGLPVKVRLLADDGASLFTGQGRIPGTALPSTGSPKGDAYVWLIEHYVKTGRANPHRLGYYLDAFWLRCWDQSAPANHTLSNHDYVIAHRGVLFDLGVWDDEACVDEPGQAPGADVMVLKRLLRAAWDRFAGDGVIHVAGFVPWAFKYTTFKSRQWSAGGRHAEVPTEWRYAEILSCFNAYMDADALGLSAMANASFYQHFPLAPAYPQQPQPTRERLIERGILDPDGRIPRAGFVAHYVGDYDSAAWLYRELPRHGRDPARGRVPLSWAFNPNLAERFPLGMAWARERATTNDWFIAGDSGAGYLNPGYLTPPRPHSGLPSGLAAWERHCASFYRRWDLAVTGFVIDGFARGLSPEALEAYARFSPGGIVAQKIPRQGVHGQMPFLRMATDLPDEPAEAARTMHGLVAGPKPRFAVCRSILRTPGWYARVSEELRRVADSEVRVLDLPALLWLVREYEGDRAAYVDARFRDARSVQARPGATEGLEPIHVEDGPLTVVETNGVACWEIVPAGAARYLYFAVDDAFGRTLERGCRVTCEFLDRGEGELGLEYDSTDPTAPLDGAYKAAPPVTRRHDSGAWREQTWVLTHARFAGRQNGGADLRLYANGSALRVRNVRLEK